MAVIAKNYKGDNMVVQCDNHCYALPLVVDLLAVQKAYMISNNFLKQKIQVENDYKKVVETLLGLVLCL